MQSRPSYILIVVTLGFLLYCFALGPLRNKFDDRWPYVTVFLASPGGAAKTIVVIMGLLLAGRSACAGNRTAVLFATGFALMLLAGLMNALYGIWTFVHRTELQSIIFNHTSRVVLWNWYFYIDVNQCVSAIGMGLVVLATARSLQVPDQKLQITER